MNKLALLIVLTTSMGLSSCSYFNKLQANCDNEDSKQLVIDILKQEINKKSLTTLKALLSEGVTGVNVSQIRALTQQVDFNLIDVRTNQNDDKSNKKMCVALLNTTMPAAVIKSANDSRALINENTVQDFAVMSEIPFEGNQLSHSIEYSVQPTDDGKKIYAEVQSTEFLTNFLNQVFIDVLLKPNRQNAHVVAAQEQQLEAQQQAEQEAQALAEQQQYANDQIAYEQLKLDEAKTRLDNSNERLNIVWESIPKETRSEILDNQRAWLKKRELECRLSTVDSQNKELARLQCETNLTEQRIPVLRQAITADTGE